MATSACLSFQGATQWQRLVDVGVVVVVIVVVAVIIVGGIRCRRKKPNRGKIETEVCWSFVAALMTGFSFVLPLHWNFGGKTILKEARISFFRSLEHLELLLELFFSCLLVARCCWWWVSSPFAGSVLSSSWRGSFWLTEYVGNVVDSGMEDWGVESDSVLCVCVRACEWVVATKDSLVKEN